MRHPTLKVGRHYRMPDGQIIEVLRVSSSSALVRPVARRVIVVKGASFKAVGDSFHISSRSEIQETSL
jgi:hypothetical protein